jgi:hypothetical protein
MNDMESYNKLMIELTSVLQEILVEERIKEVEALASKYEVTCDYIMEEFILYW